MPAPGPTSAATTAGHVQARKPKPHAIPPGPVLCDHCAQPTARLAQSVGTALGIDGPWLGSLEAIDYEALDHLYRLIEQLSILWYHAHQAQDAAAHGDGMQEIRTRQSGGDPTPGRLTDGDAEACEHGCEPDAACEHVGMERAGRTWHRPPVLADNDAATELLRRRVRAEAKHLRDRAVGLQRFNARLGLAPDPNLEAERQRGYRDHAGRLMG
jgi:hypothetical protein